MATDSDLYTYKSVIVGVHDGDTVTLDVDQGFNIWHRNMRIRMKGINAPELVTEEGKAAARYLKRLLPVGTLVVLHSFKDRTDKYGGRWLGTIIKGDIDCNQKMITSGHAVHFMAGQPEQSSS